MRLTPLLQETYEHIISVRVDMRKRGESKKSIETYTLGYMESVRNLLGDRDADLLLDKLEK